MLAFPLLLSGVKVILERKPDATLLGTQKVLN